MLAKTHISFINHSFIYLPLHLLIPLRSQFISQLYSPNLKMNSKNKSGSINAFDFDLGLNSGRSKPMMNNQKNQQPSSYQSTAPQRPNTTSSWANQPNKPAWSHQPAGSLSGPSSMVGDIFGKSWNSSSSSKSDIGIVNSKNPNLFGDLLGPQNKSGNNNVPLKSKGQGAFSMGVVADSLPKTGGNLNFGGNYGKSSSLGGGNVNSNRNTNIGGPSMKGMAGSGGLGGSSKDPFVSLVDFGSKPQGGMKSASKESVKSGFGNDSFGNFQNATSKTSGASFTSSAFTSNVSDPMGDFGFSNSQSQSQNQPSGQSSGTNDFDVLFPSSSDNGAKGSEGFTSQQFSGEDDWGVNTDFGGNDMGGTTELEGLPPPPAGVSAPSAKSKGMENYKQGQFADGIKWLSWAFVLFEKSGDDNGAMEVLTSRASCYKEVGEYKKAVADCTKVLEHDKTNVSVLVQRALLYESMEKYKLGAEDLRTVMKIDPTNRVARSTVHRLTKMAEG